MSLQIVVSLQFHYNSLKLDLKYYIIKMIGLGNIVLNFISVCRLSLHSREWYDLPIRFFNCNTIQYSICCVYF